MYDFIALIIVVEGSSFIRFWKVPTPRGSPPHNKTLRHIWDHALCDQRKWGRNAEKIILASPIFGFQKCRKNASLSIFGDLEPIVPLVFFRWHFSSRTPKIQKKSKFANFYFLEKMYHRKKTNGTISP